MKIIKQTIFILLALSFASCAAKPKAYLYNGTCYFFGNQPGRNYWISTVDAFGGQFNKKDCFLADSCNGGVGMSGGGCYKWAKSADAPPESWEDVRKDFQN